MKTLLRRKLQLLVQALVVFGVLEAAVAPFAASTAGAAAATWPKLTTVRADYAPKQAIEIRRLMFASMPTTPIDSPGLGTGDHLALPSAEGTQDLALLTFGHTEVIEGAAELGIDLVEHVGRNLQVEVRVAQLPGRVLEWPPPPPRRPTVS